MDFLHSGGASNSGSLPKALPPSKEEIPVEEVMEVLAVTPANDTCYDGSNASPKTMIKSRSDSMKSGSDISQPSEILSPAKNGQSMAAAQVDILNAYYGDARIQSQKSFNFALATAGISLLFFMSAGGLLLLKQLEEIAMITAIGGSLSAFVSAINFYIYNRSSNQVGTFQCSIDMWQRFLLADNICNEITDDALKNETRAQLIKTITLTSAAGDECKQPEEKRPAVSEKRGHDIDLKSRMLPRLRGETHKS